MINWNKQTTIFEQQNFGLFTMLAIEKKKILKRKKKIIKCDIVLGWGQLIECERNVFDVQSFNECQQYFRKWEKHDIF